METTSQRLTTSRHTTAWRETGPSDGPLLFFVHGWPELSVVWRHQMDYFAQRGWRCIAPDMRGYGGSSVPTRISDYSVRELVADLIELHDALEAAPAFWVGHDWGSAVVWALAAHHEARCRGAVSLCVPYMARGFTLQHLVPLVDRTLYPAGEHPVGQWDYWYFYREQFARATDDFEADIAATLATLYRQGAREHADRPAFTAHVRSQGGWFGGDRRAPAMAPDASLLSRADFETLVTAFEATGFAGANAWYMNDAENEAYASEAPHFGRLDMPVLFLHAAWDAVCRTVAGPLADPMRSDCTCLTEVQIDGGHELMLACPAEVNSAIDRWLVDIV